MGMHSMRQYLQTIRLRYKYATREQKSHILDEFCSVCGYNRKYAIWLENANGTKKTNIKNKAGRRSISDHPDILEVLMEIWEAAKLPCAARLKEILALRILKKDTLGLLHATFWNYQIT